MATPGLSTRDDGKRGMRVGVGMMDVSVSAGIGMRERKGNDGWVRNEMARECV